jgi:tetratricopeptide (TPR) repeat protein
VLFEFITSQQFQGIEKQLFEEKEKAVEEIAVRETETVKPAPVNKLEESIKLSIQEAAAIFNEPIAKKAEETIVPTAVTTEEKLEIGKPLEFSTGEKHSFAEWLQLSKLTPVNREEKPKEAETEGPLHKKLDIIDRFIEANPKISPVKTATPAPANTERSAADSASLMTETLARVYLEQKKYTKAIQAYEILILKYPEKSVFFADRISDIKILQQNNT